VIPGLDLLTKSNENQVINRRFFYQGERLVAQIFSSHFSIFTSHISLIGNELLTIQEGFEKPVLQSSQQ